MNKKRKYSKCYIVAPNEVDLQGIIDLFTNRNIQSKNINSLPETSFSIISMVQIDIEEADFICGVITKNLPEHVYFELGYALGLKKPIFLIVDKGVDLPLGLSGLFYMKSSIYDINAISFNLDNFINEYRIISKKKIIQNNENKPNNIIETAPNFYVPPNTDPRNIGLLLSCHIENLFKKLQIVYVRNQHLKGINTDNAADFAVWLEGLEQYSLINPVLIEIKCGNLSTIIMESTERKLRGFIEKSNSNVGIVLYYDTKGKNYSGSTSSWPFVLTIEIGDFSNLIVSRRLSDFLLETRNKTAHGVK